VNAPPEPRIGSLCTGYGGLDLAVLAVLGGTLAWVADNDPAAARLLHARWPGVPNLGDITTVNWHNVAPVDVITAGFPCQDISDAGTRAGIGGSRSGLWHTVARAVGVLRPRHAFVENVAALRHRGLDRVLADLAALRYDATWLCLRASMPTGAYASVRCGPVDSPVAGQPSLRDLRRRATRGRVQCPTSKPEARSLRR
jgi:DNA (cytosine-5)-methyltransferase 1